MKIRNGMNRPLMLGVSLSQILAHNNNNSNNNNNNNNKKSKLAVKLKSDVYIFSISTQYAVLRHEII